MTTPKLPARLRSYNRLVAKIPRKSLAETEGRNPRTRGIDRKRTLEILRMMNREDAQVTKAIRREIPAIAHAVEKIVQAMRRGGRLIYVGAGTSGRLGALDAAECPPTFGISSKLVRAIIAGGRRALTQAVEGAEDSAEHGARDLRAASVTRDDVVVGLTASGSAPYVLGALRYARKVGAATIGVTSNRRSPITRLARITIAPRTGPEAIAGSTRLKAGTAQKLVLNMLSTAAMVRLGHVYDNWMIDVVPTNRKLRRRALLILEQATGASLSEAGHALRQSGHDLRAALLMLLTGATVAEARRRLAAAGGNLRAALDGGKRRATRRKGT